MSLDLSWNALRDDSARALRQALASNGTLERINLSHNGLSDEDAATILMGLTEHGACLGTAGSAATIYIRGAGSYLFPTRELLVSDQGVLRFSAWFVSMSSANAMIPQLDPPFGRNLWMVSTSLQVTGVTLTCHSTA